VKWPEAQPLPALMERWLSVAPLSCCNESGDIDLEYSYIEESLWICRPHLAEAVIKAADLPSIMISQSEIALKHPGPADPFK
jgi:hypothetical protein